MRRRRGGAASATVVLSTRRVLAASAVTRVGGAAQEGAVQTDAVGRRVRVPAAGLRPVIAGHRLFAARGDHHPALDRFTGGANCGRVSAPIARRGRTDARGDAQARKRAHDGCDETLVRHAGGSQQATYPRIGCNSRPISCVRLCLAGSRARAVGLRARARARPGLSRRRARRVSRPPDPRRAVMDPLRRRCNGAGGRRQLDDARGLR
jgi:hypothetical protein